MKPRLARKLVVVLVLSVLATVSLVANASAAQFDPVFGSMSMTKAVRK